jgi:hypothetical protein
MTRLSRRRLTWPLLGSAAVSLAFLGGTAIGEAGDDACPRTEPERLGLILSERP